MQWDLFAGVAVFLTAGMLVLARQTATVLSVASPQDTSSAETDDGPDPSRESTGGSDPAASDRSPLASMDAASLLVNATLSHALLGGILVATVWYARIPPAALGVVVDGRSVLLGVGLGLALSIANEGGAALADRLGVDTDEGLRELLAPETPGGWVFLLVVVLPTIAVVEELLFRGALIGGLAAGYGLPVWWLAVVSSIAFGVGHGLQGPGGIVVTGLLGFVLAAAYVASGSLLLVVVAHYVVNAIEFVAREGFASSVP